MSQTYSLPIVITIYACSSVPRARNEGAVGSMYQRSDACCVSNEFRVDISIARIESDYSVISSRCKTAYITNTISNVPSLNPSRQVIQQLW